ncbi:MAG: 3-oxoadipate enol-lactonase [Desulfobacca sp.]|nr:3-oxoadipate enol-lactonase [Desulfobacca sp.]
MRIKAGIIDLNCELTGKEGAPVVMLSHSLGSNLAMWNPQRATLEPHYQVLAYDMRGHGASDVSEGAYTLEQLADDAVGLLDALHINRVHFVGLSIGGMIAQAMALNHPDRLRTLTLCSTSAYLPPPALPIVQERIETARKEGLQALVDSTLERWFTPAYGRQQAQTLESIRRQFLATSVAGYIGCNEAIGKLNFIEQLSTISLPTLIMVGAEDPGTPIAASEAIHERIKESKLVVLSSASHLSNIEQAGPFTNNLLEFLQTH